jgi:hypothetical protein
MSSVNKVGVEAKKVEAQPLTKANLDKTCCVTRWLGEHKVLATTIATLAAITFGFYATMYIAYGYSIGTTTGIIGNNAYLGFTAGLTYARDGYNAIVKFFQSHFGSPKAPTIKPLHPATIPHPIKK